VKMGVEAVGVASEQRIWTGKAESDACFFSSSELYYSTSREAGRRAGGSSREKEISGRPFLGWPLAMWQIACASSRIACDAAEAKRSEIESPTQPKQRSESSEQLVVPPSLPNRTKSSNPLY
jgi:hypothetical protein